MNHSEPHLYQDKLAPEAGADPGDPYSDRAAPAPSGRRPRSRLRRTAILSVFFGGSMLALLALSVLVLRHYVLPNLHRWQPQIEQLISQQVGLPVQITGLQGRFEGFSPSITAQRIRIGEADGEPALLAEDLRAVLSWKTILNGRPNFEILQASKTNVRITRIGERRFTVAGMPFELPEMDKVHPQAGVVPWQLPDWLLRQQSVYFAEINLDFRDRESGEQAAIRGLKFQSDGSSEERKMSLEIPATEGLSGAGQMQVQLNRSVMTNPTEIRLWKGDAVAEIGSVNLPQLSRLLRLPAALEQGTAAVKGRFDVVDSKPSDARVIIEGQDWQMDPASPDERLLSVRAEIDARWRSNGDVDLTVHDASAVDQTGAAIALNDKVQMVTLQPDFRPARAKFSLRAFDARRLLAMARTLPLPDSLRPGLERLALSGRIDEIDVDYDSRGGGLRYQVNAKFTDLDLAFGPERELKKPLQKFSPRPPWFERLSGSLNMTETGGSIKMLSGASAVGLPGVFAEPRVPLDNLDADIQWSLDPVASSPSDQSVSLPASASALTVRINSLHFDNEDAAASVSGVWRGAGKSRRGTIDLIANLTRAQIKRVYRYVPTDVPPDVRRWLRNALVAGTSDDIRFTLQGDLLDFPFRKPRLGKILIEAAVTDGVLKYLPEFPAVTDWRGDVRIDGAGLQASASGGKIFSSKISDLQIGIADFKNAVLKLDGAIKGPAQEAIRYVNTSPVGELIDGFMEEARASGEALTRMAMSIPLKTPEKGQITGRTSVAGSNVFITGFLPYFTGVKGELVYGTDGFSTNGLKLNMLGGAASVEARTPEKGRLKLQIIGRASSEGIRKEVDTPITRRLQGSAGYRAAITVAKPGVSMNIDSDLVGMALNLPEPLRKPAGTSQKLAISARPVRLAGKSPARWGDRMAVKLGSDFVAMFERDPQPARSEKRELAVKRGVIAFDSIPVVPDEGLSLSLNTLNLNIDRWLEALEIVPEPGVNSVKTDGNQTGSSIPDSGYFRGFDLEPVRASLISAAMIFNNKRFTDVVLGASRSGRAWAANIATRQVNGYVDWIGRGRDPTLQPKLIGKFQRLEIPDTRTTEFDGLLDTPPTSLPGLDIEAENFVLGGKALGRLKLRASNRTDRSGWEISQLIVENDAARLDGSGLWTRASDAVQQSSLDFKLELRDAGKLLAVLGQPDTMRGGTGTLGGHLGWRGAPASIDIPTLRGELSLALGPGQFLRTEPGIAKLVGVLSLQSIPRRLSLDFSDVFSAGFAFDTVVGQATVDDGTLTADNLLMNGVQAQVLIAGSVDLFAETQDLNVQVLPTINAGLASIAYAAVANPAVGLGTLIAQLLLQDPLRKLFRYEFKIEGGWADPQVTQTRPVDNENPADAYYGPH